MKNEILSFYNIKKLSPDADIKNGCVIAVGSFDGVHVGHREMIKTLVEESKKIGKAAAVFTFDTDDNPKSNAKLLALSEKKEQLLQSIGVDVIISAPFSEIKDIHASDFAKTLFYSFGAKSVICGYDFRFGKGRLGDVSLIKELLSPLGVNVITPNAVCEEDVPVSSTLIRKLISEGDVAKANEFLGREFSFSGEIVHGVKLARKLGFPTANQIYPEQLSLLRFGVYATNVILNGKRYFGVTNVGVKPTFCDCEKPLCETFLFDFDGDCYGKTAEILFKQFIRPEIKFNSKEELMLQVEEDKTKALEFFLKGAFNEQ
jgi:riboflavin kinase/FMN adenylyltransferase